MTKTAETPDQELPITQSTLLDEFHAAPPGHIPGSGEVRREFDDMFPGVRDRTADYLGGLTTEFTEIASGTAEVAKAVIHNRPDLESRVNPRSSKEKPKLRWRYSPSAAGAFGAGAVLVSAWLAGSLGEEVEPADVAGNISYDVGEDSAMVPLTINSGQELELPGLDNLPYIPEWAKDHELAKFAPQVEAAFQALTDAGTEILIDRDTVWAVMYVEGGWDETEPNEAEAMGVMQLRQIAIDDYVINTGDTNEIDPWKPADNIKIGAEQLNMWALRYGVEYVEIGFHGGGESINEFKQGIIEGNEGSIDYSRRVNAIKMGFDPSLVYDPDFADAHRDLDPPTDVENQVA